MTWRLDVVGRPLRTLVLVSTDRALPQRPAVPAAFGAAPRRHRRRASRTTPTCASLAEFYGVPFHHLPVTPDDEGRGRGPRCSTLVDELDVELVVLARYMQILSPELCRRLPAA